MTNRPLSAVGLKFSIVILFFYRSDNLDKKRRLVVGLAIEIFIKYFKRSNNTYTLFFYISVMWNAVRARLLVVGLAFQFSLYFFEYSKNKQIAARRGFELMDFIYLNGSKSNTLTLCKIHISRSLE